MMGIKDYETASSNITPSSSSSYKLKTFKLLIERNYPDYPEPHFAILSAWRVAKNGTKLGSELRIPPIRKM
jgi:hypothetical protein